MEDKAWLSDRAKTWIVVITMTSVVAVMGWGYYEMHQFVNRDKSAEAPKEIITEFPKE